MLSLPIDVRQEAMGNTGESMHRDAPPRSSGVGRRANRAGWRMLLGLLVGVVLLALVMMRVDWSEMGRVVADSHPLYALPIAASMLIHYVFKGLRWRILLAARAPVSRILAVRLTYVGYFMNNLLPARMGELGRPYLLSQNVPNMPFSFALATLFGDKLFDLVLLVMCLAISFAVVPLPPSVVQGMMAAMAVCCVILAIGIVASWWHGNLRDRADRDNRLLLFMLRWRYGERIYGQLLTFAEGLSAVSSLRRLLLAFGHSVLSFLFLTGTTWCCMAMVGIKADLLTSLFVMGMVGLAFLIPGPPTNVGNIHFFGTQALLLLGAAELEQAFAFSVVIHLNQVLTVSVAGVAALWGLDWRRLRDPAR